MYSNLGIASCHGSFFESEPTNWGSNGRQYFVKRKNQTHTIRFCFWKYFNCLGQIIFVNYFIWKHVIQGRLNSSPHFAVRCFVLQRSTTFPALSCPLCAAPLDVLPWHVEQILTQNLCPASKRCGQLREVAQLQERVPPEVPPPGVD